MNNVQTILAQLGGNKFLAMTGAYNLCSDGEAALTMHLRKNKAKAKYLRIELNSNDLYNVIFRKEDKKNFTFPVVEKFEDVYCDQLQVIFTKVTGYDTHL